MTVHYAHKDTVHLDHVVSRQWTQPDGWIHADFLDIAQCGVCESRAIAQRTTHWFSDTDPDRNRVFVQFGEQGPPCSHWDTWSRDGLCEHEVRSYDYLDAVCA